MNNMMTIKTSDIVKELTTLMESEEFFEGCIRKNYNDDIYSKHNTFSIKKFVSSLPDIEIIDGDLLYKISISTQQTNYYVLDIRTSVTTGVGWINNNISEEEFFQQSTVRDFGFVDFPLHSTVITFMNKFTPYYNRNLKYSDFAIAASEIVILPDDPSKS